MKQIMIHCFKAVQHKLHRKVGYFGLYGLDFMVDENMKVMHPENSMRMHIVNRLIIKDDFP